MVQDPTESHQGAEQAEHTVQQGAQQVGAAVRELHFPAFAQGVEGIVPQGQDLAVAVKQGAALKVEEQTAVIHIDAAHHGHMVVTDIAWRKPGVYSYIFTPARRRGT